MENRYINYFTSQQRGGGVENIGPLFKSKRLYQHGFGVSSMPIVIQHGHGIGSIFQNFYHLISPLISSGLRAIKSEAINAGRNIVKDIGVKPITELLQDHGGIAVQNLTDKAKAKIKRMQGEGVRRRSSKRKRKQKTIKKSKVIVKKKQLMSRLLQNNNNNNIVKRIAKKRNRKTTKKSPRVLDIFD